MGPLERPLSLLDDTPGVGRNVPLLARIRGKIVELNGGGLVEALAVRVARGADLAQPPLAKKGRWRTQRP